MEFHIVGGTAAEFQLAPGDYILKLIPSTDLFRVGVDFWTPTGVYVCPMQESTVLEIPLEAETTVVVTGKKGQGSLSVQLVAGSQVELPPPAVAPPAPTVTPASSGPLDPTSPVDDDSTDDDAASDGEE